MTENVDREPHSGLKILAPAIEVDIQIPTRRIEPGSIQSNDCIFTILNPYAPFKRSVIGVSAGMDIDGQAVDVAQVFPADRFEDIVVSIEVILIQHQGFDR